MKKLKRTQFAFLGVAAAGMLLAAVMAARAADEKKPAGAAKPALTVTVARPQRVELEASFAATGNIAAWQEALVGAEVNGLKLDDVRANVGDVVKKGQVLATFAAESVEAELAQSRAGVAEAEAALAEAQSNADRARTLEASGALSTQQINQYVTAAATAAARLTAARGAVARVSQVRLANTRVTAPDDGTISARSATVGAVVQGGQELFRMVRNNRLEWRAEVTAAELDKVRPGQRVVVFTPAGANVPGRVRMIGPTVDAQTRNVQVFVDLLPGAAARAGMFARGEFAQGKSSALVVPQAAVVVRDGFSYVFTLKPDSRVQQQKIQVGRRTGERIEVAGGLAPEATVVAQGAGFLNDGDLVKVAAAPGAPAAAPPAAKGR